METVVLVIDVILAGILVALVLVQRSDGALGSIGGGASSMMSTRAKGNFLTKATAFVAALFMICSVVLAIMNKPAKEDNTSILDKTPLTETNKDKASVPDENISKAIDAKASETTPKAPSAPISAE